MPTQGGIVEQKTIGINIGTEGTFSNTELVDGKIQLKKSQEGSNDFSPMGFWTSNIIDIGDNFKDYGKVIITHTNTDNSRISVTTRSSSNSINFSQWTKIGEDGSILSPKNRYMQLRIELYAGTSIAEIKVENKEYVENNSFIENTTYLEGRYITPTLTSNTSSPLGFAFAETENSPTYVAWRAFDKRNVNWYSTATGNITGFLGFCFFNESYLVTQYKVRDAGTPFTIMPKDWFLEGSNDTTNGTDGKWEVLDSQTNQIWESTNTDKIYSITKSNGRYKAFRLRWTTNNGNTGSTRIGELDFFSPAQTALQLKREYKYNMTKDSTWSDTGSLHSKNITRDEWLRIDRLDVK